MPSSRLGSCECFACGNLTSRHFGDESILTISRAFVSDAEISAESEYTFVVLSNTYNIQHCCLLSIYNPEGDIDVLVDYYAHVFGIDKESRTRSINYY